MRQSLILEKLKREEVTIGKRSKWRDVAKKYDRLHQMSFDCGEHRTRNERPPEKGLGNVLQERLSAAKEYIELLESQTLNYRVYIKNLELTEGQLTNTNRLANEIRSNQSEILATKQRYEALQDYSCRPSGRNKQNSSHVNQRLVTFNHLSEDRFTESSTSSVNRYNQRRSKNRPLQL